MDPSTSASGLARAATTLVDQLLDVGIDGRGPFRGAQAVADAAQRDHSLPDDAIAALISQHTRLVAAGGFLTGVGGIITLPVALPANVIEFYASATRLVAAIAAVRGHDLTSQGVRTAVMLTLVGADADDLLRKAGVVSTGRLANLAAQRLPGPALMVLNKGIGFRLVSTAGRSALSRLGRVVPLAGGLVGAGVDVYLLRKIAAQASREFPVRRPLR